MVDGRLVDLEKMYASATFSVMHPRNASRMNEPNTLNSTMLNSVESKCFTGLRTRHSQQEVETTYNRTFLSHQFALIETLRDI